MLFLALALPFSACAQWYLFPGGRSAADSTSVASRDSVTVATADSLKLTETVTDIPEAEDSVAVVPCIRVALILPLKSTGAPNSNFLDFYCGALMAADALSSDELRYRIDVYDSTLGLPSVWQLDSCQLIIGPVGQEDMEQLLPRMRGKYLVSPLDPKVAPLTESYNVIQAPSGWEAQADELVSWLGEDLRGGDIVVLLQSAEEAAGELTGRLAAKLGDNGISYVVSSSPSAFEDRVRGSCRFVIASDNDEFSSSAVREIALMNLRGGHNVVYSTAKLRSTGDLEVESMHAAAAHITASYYADSGSIPVRRFTEQYRNLFKGEPSQWSFQGYDLMTYFGSLAGSNPSLWQEELYANPGKGLQTDFIFDASGKNNTAVRRLKYNANNTISIIK